MHDSPVLPDQSNRERVMVRVIKDAARELGARVELLGEGWILRITSDATGSAPASQSCAATITRHIHGYSFDLNPAATHQICCDKAATSDVLLASGVPCVPHRLFLHPDMAKFVPHRGTWEGLLSAWRGWDRDVVVKDNEGTGGRGVTRCRGVVELEQAVYKLFERTRSVCISPYVQIRREVRFIMLRGVCEVAFEKVRANVMGDGCSSLLELMTRQHALSGSSIAALLENLEERERSALTHVPAAGEVRTLNWRHNLGQGASARLLGADEARALPAWKIAHDAANALGLVFGSVDVVESEADETESAHHLPASAHGWHVLEVNSGVMMEFLARGSPEGFEAARRLYTKALRAMLEGGRDTPRAV